MSQFISFSGDVKFRNDDTNVAFWKLFLHSFPDPL